MNEFCVICRILFDCDAEEQEKQSQRLRDQNQILRDLLLFSGDEMNEEENRRQCRAWLYDNMTTANHTAAAITTRNQEISDFIETVRMRLGLNPAHPERRAVFCFRYNYHRKMSK